MLSAVIISAAYFGLTFNPATTNAPTESRIYPISPVAYRMVQPDGESRLFELTDPDEGILSGPKPWLGVIKGPRIDIWADPNYTGGKLRTAYTFVAGRLRLMVLDGNKYTFAKALGVKDDLNELFPSRKKRSYEKNSAADIWSGGDRIRLWFTNPNSAGMLFAEILLVLVWLLTRTHGVLRLVVGVFAAVSAYGMFATGSRGALAGVVIGMVAFAVVHARRLFTKRGAFILFSAIIIMVAGLAATGNANRVINTFRSVDNGNMTRLKSAKAAVEMFSDAPFGWHGGEVPGRNACLNWYVFDEDHILRTHIMSLAECGWVKGWFYLMFWSLVVATGFILIRKGFPIVAALWLAFGLAGMFNPIYKDWETWLLPIASFLVFVVPCMRLTARQWRVSVLVSMVLSVAVVAGLVVAGKCMHRSTKIPVRPCGKATYVNGDTPRVWIVEDPLVMAGNGFPGRELLAFYTKHPDAAAVAYVYGVEDLPASADFVIVAGRNVPDYLAAYAEGRACKSSRLLMLSPSVGPNAVPPRLLADSNLLWLAGSLLATHDPSYAVGMSWVKLVPGCERYIPNWTSFIVQ